VDQLLVVAGVLVTVSGTWKDGSGARGVVAGLALIVIGLTYDVLRRAQDRRQGPPER
jgi:hypothetical protein